MASSSKRQTVSGECMKPHFERGCIGPYLEEVGKCLSTLASVAESLRLFKELGREFAGRKKVTLDRVEFFYVVLNNQQLLVETTERLRHLFEERFVKTDSAAHLNDLAWAAAQAAQEAQSHLLNLQGALGLPLMAYAQGRRQPRRATGTG